MSESHIPKPHRGAYCSPEVLRDALHDNEGWPSPTLYILHLERELSAAKAALETTRIALNKAIKRDMESWDEKIARMALEKGALLDRAERAEAALAECEKDARRFRWLCSCGMADFNEHVKWRKCGGAKDFIGDIDGAIEESIHGETH